MKKSILFFFTIFLGSSILSNAQDQIVQYKPAEIKQAEAFMTTIPLSEMDVIPPTGESDWKDGVVPNKDYMPPNLGKSSLEQQAKLPDYALQTEYAEPAKGPLGLSQNFDGIPNTYGVAPPDTDGDVGLSHYIQMVNNGFQIFDKSGTSLYGPASLASIWTNLPGPWVGNYGDPIVLYDELADRWLLSQFSLPNYPNGPWYMLIAISQTSNPLGSYYLYVYSFTDFPDYPKFGVWPDGYYLSINRFTSGSLSWGGTGAAVFERSEMLNGNPATMVYFTTPSTGDPASFLPSDVDGAAPPANTPNYFTYIDGWSGTDRLRIYEFDVDWVTTSNSTFTGPYDVLVTPFSYPNSVPQLGTSQTLDNLSSRLMFRLQYRNFGTYQTLVTNHSVNADGTGRAGVRWYELRNTGSGWSMYQQGTYAPADGLNRWMGSAALNGNGDLAIGYSVSSSTMYPSIAYAGRYASDPLNTMTIPEVTIHSGAASQTGVSRWGDYSCMSVDPSDDETFWYTQEYSSGGWNWRTRIASFFFDPAVLAANFVGSPTTLVAGGSVTFTDMSTLSPTLWNWEFPGGIPSTYTGQTPPSITYNYPGSYDVTLTVSDGSDTDVETKTSYITVTDCNYCTATSSNSSEEWISNVTFNTINNSANSVIGYEDFTSISTEVLVGTSQGLSVSCGQFSTSYTEYITAYFDWNQDCDFDDSGESFPMGSISGAGTLNTTVNIPSGASLGATRMRVVLRYSAAPGPCDVYTYGQVEDYTVIVKGPIDLNLTAFLEGPYNSTTNTMATTLNTMGYLPLNQPFNPATPYYDNASPVWQYAGSEYAPGSFPGDVVDWVQIQCRDASSPANATSATTVATAAGLLLDDGSIVAADGSSMLNFNFTLSNNLYVVVFQRNHLGIISNNAVTQIGGVYTYNFSTGENQVYGGANAHKQLEPGVWGMVASDGNANGIIQNTDETAAWKGDLGSSGYLGGDFDLNGITQNTDETNLWKPNLGGGGQVPGKTAEPLYKSWVPN
ncbi:MAG: PKD domain-containing protein [Bacteroidales bacterium]|nr:PKD domain-containing protein [Bacteroidales bacterium]